MGESTVHLMSHSLTGDQRYLRFSRSIQPPGTRGLPLARTCGPAVRSAELLGMQLVQSKKEILRAVVKTVKVNRIARVRKDRRLLQRETFFVSVSDPRLDLCIFAIPADTVRKHTSSSISVCLSRWRKLHPETVPVEAKVAANYLNGMLAARMPSAAVSILGVMLDSHGFLAESSVESVFIVKDGVLLTPPWVDPVQHLPTVDLGSRPTAGIKVVERPIRRQEILEADELFTSSTTCRVMPASRIEDRVLRKAPGPVSRKLRTLMNAVCSGKETGSSTGSTRSNKDAKQLHPIFSTSKEEFCG